MASERVKSILRAKSAPFTEDELEAMQDAEGWKWLYAHYPPKHPRTDPKLPEVCFTGFTAVHDDELKALAVSGRFAVKTSVTKNLSYLVTGPFPGPSKLKKAQDQKVTILSLEAFCEMLATGELKIQD